MIDVESFKIRFRTIPTVRETADETLLQNCNGNTIETASTAPRVSSLYLTPAEIDPKLKVAVDTRD
jgi:hypothetical protein